MSRHKQLLKNTGILALGKFATQFIAFLLLPIYTHFLDPSEYGVFDIIMTYMMLALPFLTLRLEYAAFRFLIDARKDEEEKTRILSTTFRFLVMMAVFWGILYGIVSVFVTIPYGLLVLGLALAMTLSGVVLQISRGFGSNKGFAIASMIAGIVTSVGSIITIVGLSWGIEGILASAILGNVLACVYLSWSLRLCRYLRLSAYDFTLLKELLKFGVPMVPSGFAWWAINGLDRTFIALFLGLAANGIYAIASKYAFVIVSVSSVFGLAWKESASLHINAKDRDIYFSQVFNISIKFFGALGLLLIAITPILFDLVFGANYHEAILYIPLLVLGAFFSMLVELYAGVYVAKKMSGKLATTNIIAAVISIGLNLVLIQFIGLYAVAVSMAVAFGSMALWRSRDVNRYVKISYDTGSLIFMCVSAVTVTTLYYFDTIWASITGFALAIAATYWLNRHEIERLRVLAMGRFSK